MEILARAVGRRKEAVAQVQLVRGNGQFLINDKPAQAYLQNNSCSLICIKSPLQAALSLSANNPVAPIEGGFSLRTAPLLSDPSILEERPSAEGTLSNEVNPPATSDIIASFDLPDGALRVNTPLNPEGILTFNWGESEGEINIIVKVKGGGLIGQAEAIKLGVARAFCIMENASGGAIVRKILKTKGYLTQDSRVKERRKYGLKKARKASQYHKR